MTHPAPPGRWTACADPERPLDNAVFVAVDCPKCRIAATAHLRVYGDWLGANPDGRVLTLSQALAEYDAAAGVDA
jgi:hypothetical protein